MNDHTAYEFDLDREIEMTPDFKIVSDFKIFESIVVPLKRRYPRFLKCQTNDAVPPNGFDGNDANNILAIALSYIEKNWNPLPIKYMEKAPKIGKDWGNLIIDRTNAHQYFIGTPLNIGVMLGPKSNGLVDCDMDCSEALAVASFLMPKTGAIFGRASSRHAHNLYYSNLTDTVDKAAIQFKDPNQRAEDVMLLELRIGGGGHAAQTVFPGSTHPSGELIKWENGYDKEPARIDGDELIKCAKQTSAACLFARYWPNVGGRHDAGLVLGGMLARSKIPLERIKLIAEAVAVAAHADPHHAKRCAEDAAKAFTEKRPCFGLTQAIEVFGEKTAKKCAEWLGYNSDNDNDIDDGDGKKKKRGKTRALEFENEEGLPELIKGHMTDLGNAIRLVDRHQENIRYVPEFKCWLVWSGTYWQRDMDGGLLRLAIETVEAMFAASSQITNEEFRTKFRIFALQTQARQKIVAMIELAKADSRIVLSADNIDKDPMLLGVLNGTIELATQIFREGRREDYITQCCSVAYDPEAQCPEWEKFELKIAGGDVSLVSYKQRYFGLCLTGLTLEILFIAHGGGQNGKTTELETIHEVEGDYAIALDASVLLSSNKGQSAGAATPDIVALKGKRFLSINETSETDHLNEARVKYLACQDTMKGRALYENTINFKPTHKGTLRTNHKPKIRGTDLGIWRRIHYIPYTVTITDAEKNEHYR
jgi:P4 family phage/plasmid primase-like protien